LRLLLDTHVAIWALTSPELLQPRIHDLIGDPANEVFVSAASVWEIAIKFALGKKSAPPFSGRDALGYFLEAGFELVDVRAIHGVLAAELPPLHADPFDRLIVAQAMETPYRLLTHDRQVSAYSDAIILGR
jgi:PIN domain nuclease of toxin-antitoxin system